MQIIGGNDDTPSNKGARTDAPASMYLNNTANLEKNRSILNQKMTPTSLSSQKIGAGDPANTSGLSDWVLERMRKI